MRKILLTSALLAFPLLSHAQLFQWTNTGTSDWNDPNNWNFFSVPGGSGNPNEDVRITNGGTAVISGDVPQSRTLEVGWRTGGVGTVIHNAGNNTLAGGTGLLVARGKGSTGTFIMNGGTLNQWGGQTWIGGTQNEPGSGGSTGTFIMNGGTYNMNGRRMHLGGENDRNNAAEGTGYLIVNGGTLTTGDFNAGQDSTFNANAIIQHTGGTVNVNGWFVLRGGDNDGSSPAGGDDSYTMTGGILNLRQNMHIGQFGGAPATLHIENATLNTDTDAGGNGTGWIGERAGAQGTMSVINSVWTHLGTNDILVGDRGTGYLEIKTTGANNGLTSLNDLRIGDNNGGRGTFVMDGGIGNKVRVARYMVGWRNNAHGTHIQSGGELTQYQVNEWFRVANDGGSTGHFTITDGGVLNTSSGGNADGIWSGQGSITATDSTLNFGKQFRISQSSTDARITLNNSDMYVGGLTTTPGADLYIATENANNSRGLLEINSGSNVAVADVTFLGRRGHGTIAMQSGTTFTTHRLWFGEQDTGRGTFNQVAGSVVRITAGTNDGEGLDIGRNGGGTLDPSFNTYNFTGGVLQSDNIRIRGTKGTFNWGDGVLQPLNQFSGAFTGSNVANYYDSATGPGVPLPTGQVRPEVRLGSQIRVRLPNNGALATGFGGGSSTLDLGQLYKQAGVTGYNQLRIDEGGDLDLSALNDSLNAIGQNIHLLRPHGNSRIKGYGSLVLVDGNNGGSNIILGAGGVGFDNFDFTGTLKAREFKGDFAAIGGTALDLPFDTWYLEVNNNDIIFHYHLIASIPEPGTIGLMGIGLMIIGVTRRLKVKPFVPEVS